MTFGEMMMNARKKRGVSIEKLVDLTGIHRQMLMKYETDKVVPSIEKFKQICEALKVSADYLLFGNSIKNVKEEIDDLELLEKILKLDKLEERYREALKIMIDAIIIKSQVEGVVRPLIK